MPAKRTPSHTPRRPYMMVVLLPLASRAHARTMHAAAASVASVPVFSVFRRQLPPPRWLSEHVAMSVLDPGCSRRVRTSRPVSRPPQQRDARTTLHLDGAIALTVSVRDAFDTNFYMRACAHCRSSPHRRPSSHTLRFFCAPARCRRPHASRTIFLPPSAPSRPSRPSCRVCWSQGRLAGRPRRRERAARRRRRRAAERAAMSDDAQRRQLRSGAAAVLSGRNGSRAARAVAVTLRARGAALRRAGCRGPDECH